MSGLPPPARDLVGYGRTPPIVTWPEGSRLALNISLNYEEGSEGNVLVGDALRDDREELRSTVPRDERDLIQESTFQYGSRVGVWRLMDLLDEFGMTCTVVASGMALRSHPSLAAAFGEAGYDFMGHGERSFGHAGMSVEEERADVRSCLTSIRETTGGCALGWWNRPPATLATRRVLAEEGLLYDSMAVDDDIPYFADVAGRPMLIVPYSLDCNDARFWGGSSGPGFQTGEEFFVYLRDAFDFLYLESGRVPRMMTIGVHGRIMRPGRAMGLRRFLDHVRSKPGVWVAGRGAIATTWAEQFAPPDLWNWVG